MRVYLFLILFVAVVVAGYVGGGEGLTFGWMNKSILDHGMEGGYKVSRKAGDCGVMEKGRKSDMQRIEFHLRF